MASHRGSRRHRSHCLRILVRLLSLTFHSSRFSFVSYEFCCSLYTVLTSRLPELYTDASRLSENRVALFELLQFAVVTCIAALGAAVDDATTTAVIATNVLGSGKEVS